MAEGRRSLDRLQRKKDNSLLRMFILAFLLGNSDNSAKCLVQQRQRRAQQHDEQNLACHSAGLSVQRFLDGHRTGFTCRPPGQTETCLLAQVFPCANIDSTTMDCNFDNKRENHKNMTMEWERTIAERSDNTREDLFAFICFHSPYQTAAYTAFDITFAFWKGGCARVGR
jgi:hypothetical protein